MLKITVNGAESREISISSDQKTATIDGKDVHVDFVGIDEKHFHLIVGTHSFDIELESLNRAEKSMNIIVNGLRQQISVKDRFDDLLHKLGLDKGHSAKDTRVKAPMPGLVLDVVVSQGQTVEKDSPLLILEAMKMENVIKAGSGGIVSKVLVQKGATVEKNAVLIEFEA